MDLVVPIVLVCAFTCFLFQLVLCLQCCYDLFRRQDTDEGLVEEAPAADDCEVSRIWAACQFGSTDPRCPEVHRIVSKGDVEQFEVSWFTAKATPEQCPWAFAQQETKACVCCLDEFSANSHVAVLPCGHTFHEPCIVRWSVSKVGVGNTTCPVCRMPFDANASQCSS